MTKPKHKPGTHQVPTDESQHANANLNPNTEKGKQKKGNHQHKDALVYQLSRWDDYQWRSFVKLSPETQALLQQGATKLYSFPTFAKEVFHRLYSHQTNPLDIVKPEHLWAQQAHKLLGQLPDFKRLAQRCRGDRFVSGIAATAFAEKVLAELPAPQTNKAPLEDPQALRDQVKGLKSIQRQTKSQQAKTTGQNSSSGAHARRSSREETIELETKKLLASLIAQGKSQVQQARQFARSLEDAAMRQLFRGACQQAQTKMGTTIQQMEALGFGDQHKLTGTRPGQESQLKTKLELAQRIGQSSKLKAIAHEAGRLKRMALHKQRSKSDIARSEVSHIGIGAELSRLLPIELLKLVEPALFGLFARGFMERSLLLYELSGKETMGRGPLVICLDSSSSMEGSREIWSKAAALALLSIAIRQKRTCRIIHFTTHVERFDDFLPGQIDERVLLDSMEAFFDGGTDFEEALKCAWRAVRVEKEFKQADIIMITDGECDVSPEFLDLWKQARASLSLTVYGVLLDVQQMESFGRICDVVLPLAETKGGSEGEEAITDVLFSI